jgi:hypothetical protein
MGDAIIEAKIRETLREVLEIQMRGTEAKFN